MPSSKVARTARSSASAAAACPNDQRSIIAALRIVAAGFASPLPAMSGAEPWIGS